MHVRCPNLAQEDFFVFTSSHAYLNSSSIHFLSVRSRTIDDLSVDLRFVHRGPRGSSSAPTYYSAAAVAALRNDPWNKDERGSSGNDLTKPEDEPYEGLIEK